MSVASACFAPSRLVLLAAMGLQGVYDPGTSVKSICDGHPTYRLPLGTHSLSMLYSLETNRVLIRPLEKADQEALWHLFERLDKELFRNPVPIVDMASAGHYIDQSILDLASGQAICWALIDKASAMMIGLWHWTRSNKDEASIYCCIAPECMRKGYMSEVATIMISQMPAYGLKKALATVPAQNLEARYFMLHFGWTCIEKGNDGYETWEFVYK
jgi:hypothetical protein